jgi:hypothetical protein
VEGEGEGREKRGNYPLLFFEKPRACLSRFLLALLLYLDTRIRAR